MHILLKKHILTEEYFLPNQKIHLGVEGTFEKLTVKENKKWRICIYIYNFTINYLSSQDSTAYQQLNSGVCTDASFQKLQG